jgi:hypothetical protein
MVVFSAIFLMGALTYVRETESQACARLSSALDDPAALSILENWYRDLPKKYDASYYKKDNVDPIDRIRDGTYYSTVPGPYKLGITFDPGLVHLRKNANVGVRFDSRGVISSVNLGDNLFVYFVFKTSPADDINSLSHKVSKSGNIGVYCQRVDRVD